jgi:hypothetical protein
MFCPSCGKENASASGFCSNCGRALTPVPGPTPAAAAAVAPVFTQPTPIQRKGHGALIAVIVLVAAFVVGGLAFLYSKVDRETPEQRIGRLMREAAGAQPVRNQFFAKDRHFDDTFREQYQNMFRANRDYMQAVSNADLSATAQLNTPESFADPDSFSQGLKQLHTVYDLDMAQEQKVAEIVANLRQIIETTWSGSDRDEMIKQFDEGLAQPMAKRQHAVDAEKAWVAAIDDVYAYAKANHAAFILNNGQLLISDDQVLQEFNSKVRAVNAGHQQFLQAKQEFDQWQADLLKKMGVNSKDIGMP